MWFISSFFFPFNMRKMSILSIKNPFCVSTFGNYYGKLFYYGRLFYDRCRKNIFSYRDEWRMVKAPRTFGTGILYSRICILRYFVHGNTRKYPCYCKYYCFILSFLPRTRSLKFLISWNRDFYNSYRNYFYYLVCYHVARKRGKNGYSSFMRDRSSHDISLLVFLNKNSRFSTSWMNACRVCHVCFLLCSVLYKWRGLDMRRRFSYCSFDVTNAWIFVSSYLIFCNVYLLKHHWFVRTFFQILKDGKVQRKYDDSILTISCFLNIFCTFFWFQYKNPSESIFIITWLKK